MLVVDDHTRGWSVSTVPGSSDTRTLRLWLSSYLTEYAYLQVRFDVIGPTAEAALTTLPVLMIWLHRFRSNDYLQERCEYECIGPAQ